MSNYTWVQNNPFASQNFPWNVFWEPFSERKTPPNLSLNHLSKMQLLRIKNGISHTSQAKQPTTIWSAAIFIFLRMPFAYVAYKTPIREI